MFRLEAFNGFGYHSRGVNSPHLWSGSTVYGPPEVRAGKFIADGVFDPDTVDQQLGFVLILKELRALDDSISFGESPSAPIGFPEPDVALAHDVLHVQRALNKLGIEPQLVEDGINGPRTMAAISSFQQQHGLNDTGLADAATIAAIARASVQPAPSTPAPASYALPQILQQLLALQQVINVIMAIAGQTKPPIGQVNGALGDTIGNLLNGRKTAIGIGGALLTSLLSAAAASPQTGGLTGIVQSVATSVPGLGQFALPVFLAMTAWGALGKFEKWSQGTAPPPKPQV